MRVEAIAARERLTAIEADWRDLLSRSRHASPFQTPEWLIPWWDHFGSGELFCFAVWDQEKLVALAPLFLIEWEGRRQVTFLGNGISDQLDFIFDDAQDAQALTLLHQALWNVRSRWDLCALQDLPANSLLLAPGARWEGVTTGPQYCCSAIVLPETPEAFVSSLPHGLRRNLRRYREQLAREGDMVFETVKGVAFSEAMDCLIHLHCARWAVRDDPGMIANADTAAFHRAAGARLRQREQAQLHVMRLNGVTCAVVYTLHRGDRAYSYLGGFDPALSRFSPGALILEFAIAQSIRGGARVYDFLRGEEPYKKDWGAVRANSYRLTWLSQTAAEPQPAASLMTTS